MEPLIPLVIIVGLVLANAVFVAAEFAIVGAPRTTIEALAAQGHRLAARVARILDDPMRQDRYIATTQVGISVASLGLGMYGEHVMADWLAPLLGSWENQWFAAHAMASVLAVTILTHLHIVLGEMMPKAVALQRAATTAMYVSPLIEAIERSALPLVVALNATGNFLLRAIGVHRRTPSAERYHTSEELQFIIEESHEGGLLRGEAGQILRELFEFGDLFAGQVMVPRVLVTGIPVGTTPETLRAIVREHPFTRYPVYEGDLDHIIGTLHIKDVLRHLVDDRPVTPQGVRPVPYVPGPMLLGEVLAAMRRDQSQLAVVMDQHGGTAGIVTTEDLSEEVVGEVEEGRGRVPVRRDEHGQVHAMGTARLSEVAEVLGGHLEHPQVSSVSGLVLQQLGRPTRVGDVVVYQNVRIEVTAVAGRGVRRAIVTAQSSASRTDRTPARTGE